VDTWLEAQPEDVGHTFPACAPIKRIDYILLRNFSYALPASGDVASTSSGHAHVANSFITGIEPTPDTGDRRPKVFIMHSMCIYVMLHYYIVHLMGSREGLGMNDLDSPIWASDHFAVVTDIVISK
jgi:hypothetical protein